METDPTQIRPYYDSLGDGRVQISLTLPLPAGELARRVALETLRGMNLTALIIAEQTEIGPDLTFFVAYGQTAFSVDSTRLESEAHSEPMGRPEIEHLAEPIGRPLVVVGATLESDAHTVGLDAIFNRKGFAGRHGLEHYRCFRTRNLGAQVPFRGLIDVLKREQADAVLLSQTITQKGLHLRNLTKFADLLEAEDLRDRLILIVGGPNITPELAKELGYDAGFGRATMPAQVAEIVVKEYLRRRK